MANEYLVPNGNDGGWDTSNHANIDNGGLAPGSSGSADDGTVVNETTEGIALNLDLTDGVITDGDTVTQVDIYIRAQNNGGASNDQIDVDLLIGGTPQGTQFNTGTLSNGSWTTYTANGATQGWTTDWSASQMDGMQVRLTSAQIGMPEATAIEVSEVEVYITYTVAPTSVPKTTLLTTLGVG